jgi:hypothetical protein
MTTLNLSPHPKATPCDRAIPKNTKNIKPDPQAKKSLSHAYAPGIQTQPHDHTERYDLLMPFSNRNPKTNVNQNS